MTWGFTGQKITQMLNKNQGGNAEEFSTFFTIIEKTSFGTSAPTVLAELGTNVFCYEKQNQKNQNGLLVPWDKL